MSDPVARHIGAAPSFGVNVVSASPKVVGSLTSILAFQPYGQNYSRLMFWLENTGPSTVTMRVSTSERGVLPDVEFYEVDVPAGQAGHIDMLNTLFQYWELEAHSNPDDGYPSTPVTWGVVGVNRRWSHDAP